MILLIIYDIIDSDRGGMMDLIILVVLVIIVVFFFKDFKSVVYFLAILEILFRLIHIIKAKLGILELTKVINNYVPASLTTIIARYANGLLYDIMVWGLIVLFIFFEFYLIEYWIKKGK